jgi:Ca2+-binding RTX toxin-like protein
MAIKRGTSAADVINGTLFTDWLFGRAGNDRIDGRGGEDALWGDGGRDILNGGTGADFLSGGAGSDRLDGGGSGNVLYGDGGNDTLIYNTGPVALVPGIDHAAQHMEGGRGYDTLRVGTGAYFIGSDGSRSPAHMHVEVVEGAAAINLVDSGEQTFVLGGSFSGIERIEFTTVVYAAFSGIPGSGDGTRTLHMVGSQDDDVFEMRSGSNEVVRFEGGGGSDTFDLSSGNPEAVLNAGEADQVTVTNLAEGVRRVYGFGSGDTVTVSNFQAGPFSVTETNGSTILAGIGEGQTGSIAIDAVGLVRGGNDVFTTFSFGTGTEALGTAPPTWPKVTSSGEPPPPRDVWGTTGNDTIAGAAGRERIFAGSGDDRVTDGSGDDLIYGSGGDDNLWGERGLDRIFGGAGNDMIGFGTDGGAIHGGSGDDVMFFDPGAGDVSDKRVLGRIDGGNGFDTLRVTNRASAGWADDPVGPATTDIQLSGPGFSSSVNEPTLGIGAFGDDGISGALLRFFAVERIEVTSDASRPVVYKGALSSLPSMQIVAGDGNDQLLGGSIDEVLEGGRGNDFFSFAPAGGPFEGGSDTFISRMDDADIFQIGGIGGVVRIQGFNGASSSGGDTIRIIEPATVTRNQGTTIFDWGEGRAIVDAVGLGQGSDYFFI